jgi:alkylresorcinol/alkylpyrone synthase
MSRLVTVANVQPEYRLDLDDVRYYGRVLSEKWGVKLEPLMRILNNSQVEQRFSVMPIEELVAPRSFKESNDVFIDKSIELGEEAVRRCLAQAGIGPRDIDLLITVSCTGFMIPSVDAYLINRLGMRSDCKRIPVTELGCAAGAVGLARAHDYVKAFPSARVLVLAVELPTLTFQADDVNMAHIVSSIIFGDGAACALVANEGIGPGPRILDTRSHLYPDSIRHMGFDVDGNGFHIVLDKCIPFVVRDTIGGLMNDFLKPHGLTTADMQFYALHPAGKKVLLFMEDQLGIARPKSQSTWTVLKTNGNMSSASILYVLKDLMEKGQPRVGDYGAMLAFGPGFSAELLLARWEA